MLRSIKFAVLLLLLVHSHSAKSQVAKVELAGTQVLNLTSSIDSLHYVLYINLPENYASTNKKYPVLFVTDAQWLFPAIYAGYGSMHYDGFLPDLITVGITWPDDYNGSRNRDFSPNPVEGIPNSGNANRFLTIIKKDIIKLITSTYRVDEHDMALFGTSLGGVFALFTLFHEPSLFKRYIIISPALEWDHDILFKYENNFAKNKRELNAKIFISSGEYEEAVVFKSPFKRFVSQLKARNYKGLELNTMVLPKMGHSSSGTTGGILGLQYIYSKPALLLSSTVLDKYTGHYVSNGDTLVLARSGQTLYIKSKQGNANLVAESVTGFYLRGFSGSIQFKKDDKNRVTGFDLTKNGTTLFYTKRPSH
jgi:predicted alpha/beta superfamily hydrolase